jgi:ankyrin repeat domain-containing protein 50
MLFICSTMMWTLLAIFCLVVQARADGWDDFTNNLATDLAPLIALFGEQVTKQFLSESTSSVDNIIFAVAPLGILTAVVSVIRVLGSASLRAFVGRTQEGRGAAEAELCSSTSSDVCELWNNGGITRVFGRPKILEFIFDQEAEKNQETNLVFYESFSDGKEVDCPTAGIYKPKDYYSRVKCVDQHRPLDIEKGGKKTTQCGFAPNPNLSLNVGIRKLHRYYLWGAAVFGCLLQASVLGYGAWAVYIEGLWKEGQSATYLYFWLTVTGTHLLVVGMFLCARLIELSTKESDFPLSKRIFWLQPGNQSVGDQAFEAFAYSTQELQIYTTSWRDGEEVPWEKTLLVWVAISTSMVGFILQFTGLRGLHSSVTLYQFAATLIMALIRSLLRSRRLGEDKNLLRDPKVPVEVEEHELDWQTFSLLRKATSNNASDDEPCWSISENLPEIEGPKNELVELLKTDCNACLKVNKDGNAAWVTRLEIQNSPKSRDEQDGQCANALVKWIARVEAYKSANTSQDRSPNLAKKLLCYRSRLSYLTNDDAPTISQRWGSAVREQAVKLQAAIQSVANYAFSDACQAKLDADWETTAAFCWALNCYTHYRATGDPALPVYLMVRRARGQWRVEICQLEAVLGLWIWSIKVEVEKWKEGEGRIEAKDRKTETDIDLILSRKIFIVVSNSNEQKQAERELNFWVLREIRQPVYNNLDEYGPVGSETSKQGLNPFSSLSLPVTRKLLFRSAPQQQQEKRLLSIQTENSMLVMAAQDIFASLIDALASVTNRLKGVNIVQSLRIDAVAEEVISTSKARPFLGLAHNHTERLVDLFTQAGLGAREDALMSVIPSFRSRSLLPSLVEEYKQLKSLARKLRGEERWEQAQNLLMALYDEDVNHSSEEHKPCRLEEILGELCELHRKAMRSEEPSHRRFGYLGVCELLKNEHAKTKTIEEIKQNYSWVALELAKLHNDDLDTAYVKLQAWAKENEGLSKPEMTLQEAMELKSTYPIGLVMAERFKKEIEDYSSKRPLLFWAAQKGCKELVEDLLDTGLNANIADEQHRTPLSYACEKGYKDISKQLLEASATLIADKDGLTPFTWAVKKGHTDVVQLFMDMNIDFDLRDGDYRTPLSWAARGGHGAVVKLLLEKAADVDSKDRSGRTPLSWAATEGHETVVKLLLKKAADVNSKDSGGRTPLSWAARNGHEAIVKLLLEKAANVNSEDRGGRTPLSWATGNGHEAVVKLLLEKGGEVDFRDGNGRTPLLWAAENGHEVVVKLLLEKAAKVDFKDRRGRTPLSWAAGNGWEAVVKLLLEKAADVNFMDSDGQTPLSWAVRSRRIAVMKLLLEKAAEVDFKGSDSRTLLSLAMDLSKEAVVKLLLEKGGEVDFRDGNDRTPLSRAAEKGWEAVVKLLLEKAADVNSKDRHGRTPLSWAAGNGREAVVKLLLEKAADVNSEDGSGLTPLSLARGNGNEAVVKLLLEKAAEADFKDSNGRTSM